MRIASPTSLLRLLKLPLWTGVVLTVALAGLIAVLLAVDANVYRPALQRELSAALGRDVSIGDLAYTVSLRPTFAIRDLRVANPAWASRPEFAVAASGEIQIDLIALWHGRVEIRRVALHGLDVRLERSGDGDGNWLLAGGGETPGTVSLPDFDAIAVDNMRLAWRGPQGRIKEARIERARAVVRADRPFRLEVDGTFAGTVLHGSATASSSLHNALAGQPWEVSIMLAGAQAQADIFVTLPRLFSGEGFDATPSVKGERLRALSTLAQTALPAWGPYKVSAHARYADASLRIDEIALSLEGLPGRPSRVEITRGEMLIGEATESRVKLNGRLDDTALVLDATAAALPKLTRDGPLAPISARAVLGRLALEATGTASMGAGAPRFRFAVKAKGDALAPLPVVTGQRPRTRVLLDLSARVSGDERRYCVDGLKGSVAGCTIDGGLALDATLRPRLSGAVTLGRLDLTAFDFGPSETEPARPAWLDAFDAALRLRAQRLTASRVDFTGLKVNARLADGLLQASVGLAEGGVQADLRLDARGDIPGAAVRLSAQHLDLEALKIESVGAPGGTFPKTIVRAEFAGAGATPRQMIFSAKGDVLISVGSGRPYQVTSRYLVQDVVRSMVAALVPGRKPAEYADLECAAAHFRVAGGVASSPDGIAIRFKRMDILGSGAVNLQTHEILFGFRAVRRQLFSFSPLELAGDFALIGGTWDAPKVGLDTQGLLIKGGAAWATAGISLLATDLMRKLQASQNPCARIVATGHTSAGPLDALIYDLAPFRSPPPGR